MDLCLHAESQGADNCPFKSNKSWDRIQRASLVPCLCGEYRCHEIMSVCLCLDTNVCLSVYLSTHTQGCCARSFSFHGKESLLKWPGSGSGSKQSSRETDVDSGKRLMPSKCLAQSFVLIMLQQKSAVCCSVQAGSHEKLICRYSWALQKK